MLNVDPVLDIVLPAEFQCVVHTELDVVLPAGSVNLALAIQPTHTPLSTMGHMSWQHQHDWLELALLQLPG
jgi:hypothetical protein